MMDNLGEAHYAFGHPFFMYSRSLILSIIIFFTFCFQVHAKLLRIQGSTTVNPIVSEAADFFRDSKGWTIFVDTHGGSSGGIFAVAEGLADIGMSSKPISAKDQQKHPNVDFHSTIIGVDGVALIVSSPVWDQGVRSVSREDMQKIYDQTWRNWQQLGGHRAPIVFYNKEPGRGTWEVFAQWLYHGSKNAPLVSHPEVGSNEETRNKVTHHPSALSQLSFAWVEQSQGIKALGIRLDDGSVVWPSRESIQKGQYPLARQLFLITNGPPEGRVKAFIDFIMSDKGQGFVEKHGYLSIHQ